MRLLVSNDSQRASEIQTGAFFSLLRLELAPTSPAIPFAIPFYHDETIPPLRNTTPIQYPTVPRGAWTLLIKPHRVGRRAMPTKREVRGASFLHVYKGVHEKTRIKQAFLRKNINPWQG